MAQWSDAIVNESVTVPDEAIVCPRDSPAPLTNPSLTSHRLVKLPVCVADDPQPRNPATMFPEMAPVKSADGLAEVPLLTVACTADNVAEPRNDSDPPFILPGVPPDAVIWTV